MSTYPLSRAYADLPSRRRHSSTNGTSNRHSRGLEQPNLRRCQSWQGKQAPEIKSATIEQWFKEFHEMKVTAKVTAWHQTVEDFGREWKRCCFAQCRHNFLQDSLIKEATKDVWQPLGDFNYVLSVYSFLEGVNNRSLLPQLRPVYMAWRSPEQARLHERYNLEGEDDLPAGDTTSSNHESRENGSRATASKYPLTKRQHLRLARICGEMDWMLDALRSYLRIFQDRRAEYATESTTAGITEAVVTEHRWRLINATREFQSHSEILIRQLRNSRNGLCEALGLDPDKVPGGDTDSAPTMTVTKYQRAADIPAPSQSGPELPRSFRLKRASLQVSLIAVKATLYSNLLPGETARRILGRMMARSTEMATTAKDAGDHKVEATMRSLQNKLRKVDKRTGQEFPDVKPKMTLLDSVTWAAVLNPREDMQLEIYGDVSVPVEKLIDTLHAPPIPASVSEPTPGGIGEPSSAASVTMAPEISSKAEQASNSRTSSISSQLGASREAEAHNA